ncbi:MAG TPA: hypothetical protein VLB47_06990, partial [Solirubrobacteraceae bacterium]|nr:hypothetical protein [Solirubrobacteraceae bacterium]
TGRAHVLASDAHRPARGPVLTAALDALAAQGVGRDRAERLVADHPAGLLERGLPVVAGERRAA